MRKVYINQNNDVLDNTIAGSSSVPRTTFVTTTRPSRRRYYVPRFRVFNTEFIKINLMLIILLNREPWPNPRGTG